MQGPGSVMSYVGCPECETPNPFGGLCEGCTQDFEARFEDSSGDEL